jgi:hypothetical protein
MPASVGIAVPLTTPETVAADLRIVKVIVPEAVPLTLDEREIDPSHARLARHWPGTFVGSWNEFPHPLY